mgnify:CR=1 FL=1
MEVLGSPITIRQLKTIAKDLYGDMVKAVVDIGAEKLAIDAELHSDLERLLLSNGSEQENLWGINLYPEADEEDFVEFDSLINIRPRQNNMSRDVENEDIRKKILEIVKQYISN